MECAWWQRRRKCSASLCIKQVTITRVSFARYWNSKCTKTSHTVSSVCFMAMRASESTLPYAILSFYHLVVFIRIFMHSQLNEQSRWRKEEGKAKTKMQTKFEKFFFYQSRGKMWNKAWVRVNSMNVSYFSSEKKTRSFLILYNLNWNKKNCKKNF